MLHNTRKMEKEMFAIVQWTQGKDKGRYTVGYPISYIKNFNYELYENDEYELDQPFPVEWHEPGKKPVGGWEVFEAIVIQVSSSIKKLEKMMNIIDVKAGKTQTALLPMAKHMVPGTEDANVSRKKSDVILVERFEMFRNNLSLTHDKKSLLEVALYTSPSLPYALLAVTTVDDYLYVKFSQCSTIFYSISETELDDKNESSEILNVELLTGPTLTDGKEKNEYVTKADLKAFAADIIHFFNKNESSKKPKHSETTEESVDCFEKATKSSNKKSQIKILTAGENKIEISYDQWKDAKSKLTFTAMGWALFGSYINTRLSQFRKQRDSKTEDNTEPTAEK
ncbi:hypothetical protein HCN44_010320 [Aphidius gifuensis]|uniref:Uncharacterized protein n=1 Tax=Aphidius gifuensis TaxID=684658 RepID=A0A835CUU7_APHGI|nr:hypothetical protein HCN44_010320 [Aphidius gifuensis]